MVDSVENTPSLSQQFAVERFFSSRGVFVKEMTESVIARLAEKGYTTPDQIFTLTPESLKEVGLPPEDSADDIINGLEKAKQTTLPRFLYALGLSISQKSLYALLRRYPTLWAIYHASEKGLTSVEGVSQSTARTVLSFFSVSETRRLITVLHRQGIVWYEPTLDESSNATYPLDGKQFVLTGELTEFTRVEAEERIFQQGGWVSDKVNADTDYLVSGDNPGQELQDAQQYGVAIIDEAEFKALVS